MIYMTEEVPLSTVLADVRHHQWEQVPPAASQSNSKGEAR